MRAALSNAILEHTVAERTAELVRSNLELHRLSRHDALTGAFNRLAAKERLHAEFVRMKRTQAPYAVLMMDIDYFKRASMTPMATTRATRCCRRCRGCCRRICVKQISWHGLEGRNSSPYYPTPNSVPLAK